MVSQEQAHALVSELLPDEKEVFSINSCQPIEGDNGISVLLSLDRSAANLRATAVLGEMPEAQDQKTAMLKHILGFNFENISKGLVLSVPSHGNGVITMHKVYNDGAAPFSEFEKFINDFIKDAGDTSELLKNCLNTGNDYASESY